MNEQSQAQHDTGQLPGPTHGSEPEPPQGVPLWYWRTGGVNENGPPLMPHFGSVKDMAREPYRLIPGQQAEHGNSLKQGPSS